jgi:predicted phage terminase large subunit-like protein
VSNDKGEIINVRIEAYGKGASIRGLANKDRRPRICVCDDLQDTDEANSQVVLENDWNWFLSNIIFLGQSTRIFLIGNNLGEKCIMERVLAMEGQLASIKFNTRRIPELTDKGESAWPSKRTVAEINLEKEDFRKLGKLDIWLREKMCQAVGEETRAFDPGDYRYFPHTTIDKILSECNRFGVLDPASSPELTSCYRAIVVVGCDSDNNWFVSDIPFGRWDSAQMIDEIFASVQKYEIKDFGIEKGIFKQVLEPFIYKEMARRNIFFNIIPIEHAKRGSKLERIKMLQPRFKAHQIWFPESAPWLAELLLELAGVTKDGIKSLYSDLMDALAMIPQIVKAPGKKKIDSILRRRTPEQVPEMKLI